MLSRLKVLFRIAIFWLILFFVNRIIFVLFNSTVEESLTFVEFLKASLYGLRMDVSLVGYISGLSFLLFALSTYTKHASKPIIYLHYLLITFAVLLLVIDNTLFSFWRTHFDSSALIYVDRVDVVTRSLTTGQAIKVSVFTLLYLGAALFGFHKWVAGKSKSVEAQSWFFVPVWLFGAALMIIPIRGGLQHIPINTGVAYFSSNGFANVSAVNPVWNFAYSMKRYGALNTSYKYLSSEEANTIFDDLYNKNNESVQVLMNEKPDIVLIMLEGFTEKVIDYKLEGLEVTPNLNSIKKDGLYFSNFYGTNTRSDKGMVGILSGTPVLPGISILKYPQKSGTLSFLPKRLRDAGYKQQSFIYGGDINFANMNSYIHLSAFDKIYSKSDFPSEQYNVKWGVHDEYGFQRLMDDMSATQELSFKVFFTLSSHEPYDVPMDRVFSDDYLNSVHYTDQCIGNFMKAAKEAGKWDNTLYIFISDHGSGWPKLGNSNSERYKIPMIWAGGALQINDSIVDKIGSQTDLAVTLLRQLNLDDSGFRFSKDMLDPNQKGFAFFNHNKGFFYLDQKIIQYFDLDYNNYYKFEGSKTRSDSLKSKAYLQVLYDDFKER